MLRLHNRIHAVNVDKLDGTIDAAFYENIAAEWLADQDRCCGTSSANSAQKAS